MLDLQAFADRTGLEPATSAVTGRHSNQLNYRSVFCWGGKDKRFPILETKFSTSLRCIFHPLSPHRYL
jgi:hypothetical protein